MKASDFLKLVGSSGLPTVIDESLKDTWNLYEKEASEDRVTAVLGFLHLVRQSGLSKYTSVKQNPAALYKSFRQDEFDEEASLVARQIVRYRLLDVLKLFKSKFVLSEHIRGTNCLFRFDLCFEPKRTEPMDSALSKLSGLLYTGSLPKQLQEVWKKLPPNSKAKHKSSLDKYTKVFNTPSTLGFFPLSLKQPTTIYVCRAADDLIVVRIAINVTVHQVPWMTIRQHEDFLKQLLIKSFSKLKG